MNMISRYAPAIYGFVAMISLSITLALLGVNGIAMIGGQQFMPMTVLTAYTIFVNVLAYAFSGMSILLGVSVVIMTAVQIALADFRETFPDFKIDEERRLLVRCAWMLAIFAVVGVGAVSITYSALNLGLGSSLWESFFLVPLGIGLLFFLVSYVVWFNARDQKLI